ncbi:acetyl-CoA carboxylase biotin carboxyl carrier protein [Staphylococcus edaphicus]|uniref:Acetyl-CoA carboxylase biotin carboxyl carrier protein subunit n=1 Tax=Staphylococcus edaphicus TaxID=1955013 RepID=A0A2C6WNQ4_9STAP|nr:biotin/lipoyl-containing protein [Staphylococcus edaphicus]PHK49705.1 acetyl-CoA carboxylase biotin carboxyl carrier protein subunit [Staphylococcus edaphicus]UQW82701.1 acetyl-CoA carboxylase biotin carboxyl carrier protein subunit [Staphylococcus edaphicus]
MNFEKVEQLIKLVKDNEVKKFKYKDYENEIEIDFTEGNTNQIASQLTSQSDQSSSKNENTQNTSTDNNALHQIKSPMVGTFFLQDEKELTDPIIQVGDEIKKGDTVGYIEAMKVLNEVTSDVSGIVEEILVEHGSNVEYNQLIVNVK